jgi:hypothetical protein
MPNATGSTVKILIDKGDGSAPAEFPSVAWYPGLTIIQAMIVAQAMYPDSFNFRVNYHSVYGAFVESIDDASEGNGKYWMLSLGPDKEDVGPSEAIIIENPVGSVATVSWVLQVPGPTTTMLRTRARMKGSASGAKS